MLMIIASGVAMLLTGGGAVVSAASGYAGLTIGATWSTFDTTNLGFKAEDITPSNTVWKFFAGYQPMNNFGVEAGYIQLGKSRLAPTVVPVGEQTSDYYLETKLSGFELTPTGTLPIGSRFSGLARVGLIFWHSEIAFGRGSADKGTKTKSGSSLVLGLGGKYDLYKRFGIRAEYTLYAIDKTKAGSGNFHVISVSGLITF